MDELEKKLKEVDDICKRFYPLIEKAKQIRDEAESELNINKKKILPVSFALGVLITEVFVYISPALFSTVMLEYIFSFIGIGVGVYSGIKMYKTILKPKMEGRY